MGGLCRCQPPTTVASVEKVSTGFRVVWREAGVKQYERFPTATAAESFRAKVEANNGRWPFGWVKGYGFNDKPSTAPTFTVWARRCITARSTASARTRHDYLRDFERHLEPVFGQTPVDQITKEQVGQWLIGLTVSPKTAKNIHGLASSIMAEAVDERLAPGNPFHKGLRALPNVKQEDMVFLARTEFDTLLAHVPELYRPLVATLGLTGLRWSEATALQAQDIDVMTRRLTVVRAWKRTPDSYFVIGEPKSRRSRRTITIPQSLVDVLLPLIAGKGDGEWLFTARTGTVVRHANFRQRVWLPAVKAMQRCDTHQDTAGPCRCPGTVSKTPRIHDLRHSHVSWLIAAGVNLAAIQRRLGHESITTTVDRYGHLSPETDDAISAALDGHAAPLSAVPAVSDFDLFRQ